MKLKSRKKSTLVIKGLLENLLLSAAMTTYVRYCVVIGLVSVYRAPEE